MSIGSAKSTSGHAAVVRSLKRGVTRTAGVATAVLDTATAVPTGLVEGLTEAFAPGTGAQVRERRLRIVRLLAKAGIGFGIGALVGGPVGAVACLGASFLTTAVSNVAEARTGGIETFRGAIDRRVREKMGDRGVPSWWGKIRAGLAGALDGCRQQYRKGMIAGSATAAGAMAGFSYARGPQDGEADPERSPVSLKQVAGTVARSTTGILGVLINLPGGLVAGSLHAMKEPQAEDDSQLRPILMLCTGMGKALVPAVLGGIVAGPVGAAVASGLGVLVDVTVDGINTIIDGKSGINKSIVGTIDDALQDAIPEELSEEPGYGIYYRLGKGAVIGGRVCVQEGWKRGYYGGSTAVRSMVESPLKAVEPTP